jgi:hypothetical protein
MVVRSACIVIILMFFFSSAYYLRFVNLNDTRFPLSGGANGIQKCERAEQNGRKREQGGSVGSLKADRPTPPHIWCEMDPDGMTACNANEDIRPF